jgi:competence ComEA-like helix-hairpin-helix protein
MADRQKSPSSEPGAPPPWANWLRRSDQAVIGAVVGVFLVAMAVWWFFRGGARGELIDIDRAAPRRIEFQVDLNKATWAELSLLPGVGEARAKAIVASRQADGPFRHPDDLMRIRGFGPRTIESVRPYLAPLPGEATYVESGRRLEGIE